MLKTLVSVCVFAVLAMSTTASAQTVDRRTFFTFNQPFTLPGVTLPAGKYLFRIADGASGRRVVQVLNAEGTQSYATLFSIPAQRLDAPASPEIRFMETASGTPAAVKAWWYPGSTIGYEFIYPKEQALRLARAAERPVLTTAGAAPAEHEDLQTAELARVTSTGEQTEVNVTESPEAVAASGEIQAGEVASSALAIAETPTAVTPPLVAAPSASPVPTGERSVALDRTRTQLPQTGSSAPLVTVLAAITMLAGAGLLLGARPRV